MTAPLRILRVIPRYAPAWNFGGGVRFCHDLDLALAQRGFAIEVCTSDQIDEHRRASTLQENLGGIEIHRFPNPSNYLAGRLQWASYYPLGLRGALVEHAARASLIHVAEARGPHVRWAFTAARATGIPVVWSPFGGLAGGIGIRKPYRRVYDIVQRTRHFIRESRVLVAQGSHEAALFERLGARAAQVRVIRLGVDARRFYELPPRGEFRRTIGVAPDQPLVLFMGRFHPTKGLDVLLRAAAIARRTRPDLVVALVGWDHGALGTVQRLTRRLDLGDVVRVVPPVFGSASLQAYVDADVFAVAATVHEETSLAAMEALAAGTPCVLTRQCEVPDLERMGGGRVVECRPDAFAAGLVEVLSDRTRRTRALAARRTILATHSIQHVAAAFATLFNQVAGRQVAARSEPAITAGGSR